jgi:hypothetical protein
MPRHRTAHHALGRLALLVVCAGVGLGLGAPSVCAARGAPRVFRLAGVGCRPGRFGSTIDPTPESATVAADRSRAGAIGPGRRSPTSACAQSDGCGGSPGDRAVRGSGSRSAIDLSAHPVSEWRVHPHGCRSRLQRESHCSAGPAFGQYPARAAHRGSAKMGPVVPRFDEPRRDSRDDG